MHLFMILYIFIMPIPILEYKGKDYPAWQASGNAARFVRGFAQEVCKGVVLDIGCNREEWKLPNAIGIDPKMDERFDALHLPDGQFDAIHSSHCLEHLADWVEALDYWKTKLKSGGVLFLYLPHYASEYWRVWNDRKHLHNLSAEMIVDYLKDRGWKNIFSTGVDLNNSFCVIAENT